MSVTELIEVAIAARVKAARQAVIQDKGGDAVGRSQVAEEPLMWALERSGSFIMNVWHCGSVLSCQL